MGVNASELMSKDDPNRRATREYRYKIVVSVERGNRREDITIRIYPDADYLLAQ